MENFIVSARKYRPQAFDEVVGQQHVTNTLLNAINQNHLAQALLFTGPRGVGKTTCARILAKMINLEDGADENQDFSFNIFELDAASNNSVDDIRNLIDQVRFAPQAGNYKVYIIDEVHMLSQAAFNAFLKTLEEPPKHAIFILATTEKHKIIPTILSRCQIFDFKRITVEDIASHLKNVADQEGVTAEPQALHVIAQKADGALRDALSIFDRIVSFSGKQITYKDVIDNLRILDYDYYFKATDYIINGQQTELLLLFNEILDLGFDGHLFANGLAAHFRDLLVSKNPQTLKLAEVGAEALERYRAQANAVDAGFVLKALKLLSETDYKYKASNNARLLVELSLLQLSEMATHGQEKKNTEPKPQPIESKPSSATVAVKPPIPTVSAESPKTEEPPTIAKAYQQDKAPVDKAAEPEHPQEPELEKPKAPQIEEEVQAARVESLNKLKRPSRKFSISGTLQSGVHEESDAEEVVDDTAPDPGLPSDDFTEGQLQNIWNEYLDQLKEAKKHRVYGSLDNKKLVLKENFLVEIELDSETQRSNFEEEKRALVKFIREKLNNFSIQFETRVTVNERKLEPYSASEKFQYMAEKNPHLLLLKQKLDLDLE